jgi:hypothetical protein
LPDTERSAKLLTHAVCGVQEVLGYSDESFADFQDLKKAQEEINAIINGANEKKRISDNLQSIIKIQSRIEWPSQSLVVYHSIHFSICVGRIS